MTPWIINDSRLVDPLGQPTVTSFSHVLSVRRSERLFPHFQNQVKQKTNNYCLQWDGWVDHWWLVFVSTLYLCSRILVWLVRRRRVAKVRDSLILRGDRSAQHRLFWRSTDNTGQATGDKNSLYNICHTWSKFKNSFWHVNKSVIIHSVLSKIGTFLFLVKMLERWKVNIYNTGLLSHGVVDGFRSTTSQCSIQLLTATPLLVATDRFRRLHFRFSVCVQFLQFLRLSKCSQNSSYSLAFLFQLLLSLLFFLFALLQCSTNRSSTTEN